MKKIMKKLALLLLVFAFVSCDLISSFMGDGDEDSSSDYAATLVDDFISQMSTRDLTTTDYDSMKDAINLEIANSGLTNSEDLSALMPVVASSAQISLSVLITGDEDEVIAQIRLISAASVVVIGDNSDADDDLEDLADIVVSVSVAMVESISETGLSADKIVETTEATVSTIISSLDDFDLDADILTDAVIDIASETSVAVASNSGADEEILIEALASIPTTVYTAVDELDNVTLSESASDDLFTETYASVILSVTEMSEDDSMEFTIDLTVSLVEIQVQVTAEITADTSMDVATDSLLAETIAAAGLSDADLDDLETAVLASTDLDIDSSAFTEAIDSAAEIVEENELLNNDTVLTTADDLEDYGFELLEKGFFDEALVQYDSAVETGNATEQGKLWWSLLTLASMSVDDNVLEVFSNIGLSSYPTTMNEFIVDDTNFDDSFYDDYEYNMFNYFFPEIDNQDMFADVYKSFGMESADIGISQIFAVLYNLQENYPDGFNDVIDSFMAATENMDAVTELLLTISEDASFAYTYDMFDDEDFDPEYNEWPYTEDGTTITPDDITVGKAEVYALVASMELMRSMLLMGQSISLSVDLDSYWDIFNPLTGSFFTFDAETDEITNVTDDFDFSTISNPFSDGLLMARDDAEDYLADAKTKFVSSFEYIGMSCDLIGARDADSDFYLSPANSHIDTDTWEIVDTAQQVTKIATEKIIASVEGTTLYLPTLDEIGSIDSTTALAVYATASNWAVDGYGVDLSALFDKPLLALDSLFEFLDNGEPVIYSITDTGSSVATSFDEADTYAIKFSDVTFGGLLVGFDTLIADGLLDMGFSVEDDNSVFIEVPSDAYILVGSSITTAGVDFTIGTESYTSTGSFFQIIISEGLYESVLITEYEYAFMDEYGDDGYFNDDETIFTYYNGDYYNLVTDSYSFYTID